MKPSWQSRVLERYGTTGPQAFVPPYRRTLWCRLLLQPLLPLVLRAAYRVTSVHIHGAELLARSIAEGAGIILAPNHCRPSDGFVMAALGFRLGRVFYYLAASHLFQRGRLTRWLLNRVGGYSVRRYGQDLDALAASVRLLSAAERPLVLFPEGTYWRRNDCLGEFEDGLAVLARFAASRSQRPIVVHPVTIRYRLPGGWIGVYRRLARLERRLGLVPRSQDGGARLLRLYEVLLARCEVRDPGGPIDGPVPERMARLAERLLGAIETRRLGTRGAGSHLCRTSAVRSRLVAQFGQLAGKEDDRLRRDLVDLWVGERWHVHAPDYWLRYPTPERMGEAVVRLEEDVFGGARELGPAAAEVRVGPALTATGPMAGARGRANAAAFTTTIRDRMQRMLGSGSGGTGSAGGPSGGP